jgi:hypothetical protein
MNGTKSNTREKSLVVFRHIYIISKKMTQAKLVDLNTLHTVGLTVILSRRATLTKSDKAEI